MTVQMKVTWRMAQERKKRKPKVPMKGVIKVTVDVLQAEQTQEKAIYHQYPVVAKKRLRSPGHRVDRDALQIDWMKRSSRCTWEDILLTRVRKLIRK